VPTGAAHGLRQDAVATAVLLRITGAAGRAITISRIARDLTALMAPNCPAGSLERAVETSLFALAREDCLRHRAGRVTPLNPIWPRRDALLGFQLPRDTGWPELRNVHLVARALDLPREPRRTRTLHEVGGVRRAILEKAFGVPVKASGSAAEIRDVLARLALRRGTVTGNAAVASRHRTPRQRRAQAATLLKGSSEPPASDSRLLAKLAAEQVGAKDTSPAALRRHLLWGYFSARPLATAEPAPRKPFDLGEFLIEVRNFARQVAQGWQGNRRALISRVFPALAGAHPEWGLDVDRFKSLLSEAHRAGRLHLVNADLRDRGIVADLQASAVAYHNMIMHFIRVEDEASDAA